MNEHSRPWIDRHSVHVWVRGTVVHSYPAAGEADVAFDNGGIPAVVCVSAGDIMTFLHISDCALHNAPALPAERCNCDGARRG